jgi:hypothetical protein
MKSQNKKVILKIDEGPGCYDALYDGEHVGHVCRQTEGYYKIGYDWGRLAIADSLKDARAILQRYAVSDHD